MSFIFALCHATKILNYDDSSLAKETLVSWGYNENKQSHSFSMSPMYLTQIQHAVSFRNKTKYEQKY